MANFDEAAAYEWYLGNLPPDGLARLQEPPAEDFKAPQGFTHLQCHLTAQGPVAEPSRFLLLMPYRVLPGNHDPANVQANWINMTQITRWTGGGMGFPDIQERPRLEATTPAPRRLPQVWWLGRFFVASPAVCDLLRRYDSSAIDTVEIDWKYSDGVRLKGYSFLDVKKKRHSCDFLRSDLEVFISGERRYLRQRGHRTLRADIPDTAHIFRDGLETTEIFLSRELAIALETLAPGEFGFMDLQLQQDAQITLERIRRERSVFKKGEFPDSERQALYQWIESNVDPLLRAGNFLAAEQALVSLLRSIAPGPYHIVCDLEITTSGKDVARYMTDVVKQARSQHEVAAIYCEMNDFTINPDGWFFSAAGFSEDGGRDNLDWLGEPQSYSEKDLVIWGLEPLQQVFADSRLDHREHGFERARRICERLVIVKFQKMLADARPLMKKLDMPMFATAHDYNDYVAEIPRPPASRGWFSQLRR